MAADFEKFKAVATNMPMITKPKKLYASNAKTLSKSKGIRESNINPLISETCNNLDDDCNGQIDDGVLFIYYADSDADGFGNPNNFIAACSMPSSGFVTNGNDCDDNLWFYLDQDGDGFGIPQLAGCGVTNAEDCDDLDAANNPLIPEVCNEIDDNCNGEIDEFVQQIYFIDADGDDSAEENERKDAKELEDVKAELAQLEKLAKAKISEEARAQMERRKHELRETNRKGRRRESRNQRMTSSK